MKQLNNSLMDSPLSYQIQHRLQDLSRIFPSDSIDLYVKGRTKYLDNLLVRHLDNLVLTYSKAQVNKIWTQLNKEVA